MGNHRSTVRKHDGSEILVLSKEKPANSHWQALVLE